MKTTSLLVFLASASATAAFLAGYFATGAGFIDLGIVALAAAEYIRARPVLRAASAAAAPKTDSGSERHPLAA